MRENHSAKVCRSPKDKHRNDFYKDKSSTDRPPWYQVRSSQQAHAVDTEYDDPQYIVHSFSAYSISLDGADKYFTWLPSLSPTKTVKVLMQVDSVATRNTLPSEIYREIAPNTKPQPSKVRIKPYFGETFSPLGKQSFSCEGATCYDVLDFEIIVSALIPGKPALLTGKDSERLGLLTFNQEKVFASTSTEIKPPSTPEETYVHAVSKMPTNAMPKTTQVLTPGKITEHDLKTVYKDNFEGLGLIGKPVHMEVH